MPTDRLVLSRDLIYDATVTFYKHSKFSIWGTIDPRWVERNRVEGESEPVVVAAVDFSSWLKETGVPFYMKVDIEGADLFCFEALRAFDDRPAYVSLESATTRMTHLEAEFDLLEELGYDLFAVVQQENIEGSSPTLTTVSGERITHRMEPGASGPFGPDLDERWESRDRALRRYVPILALYRLFGDPRIYRYRICRHLRWRLWRVVRRPLPGWYDTHGRHRSAP